MIGLATIGSISWGWALVGGRNRVRSPAAGKTALRTLASIPYSVFRAKRESQASRAVAMKIVAMDTAGKIGLQAAAHRNLGSLSPPQTWICTSLSWAVI